jgi:hypothetical protein
MPTQLATVRRFFTRYARRMNAALKPGGTVDINGFVASFAPYFVEASPAGVVGGKNGLRFRLMLPRGVAFYRRIGTTSMTITSMRVTPLDERHAMARVRWVAHYLKDGRRLRIPFTNIYLLHFERGRPRIFAYVTGDERKVLADHGLIESR